MSFEGTSRTAHSDPFTSHQERTEKNNEEDTARPWGQEGGLDHLFLLLSRFTKSKAICSFSCSLQWKTSLGNTVCYLVLHASKHPEN